jgi:hypothetical protein
MIFGVLLSIAFAKKAFIFDKSKNEAWHIDKTLRVARREDAQIILFV